MNTEIRLNRMKTWRKQAKQREGNFKTITAKRSLSRNGTPRWDLKAEKELQMKTKEILKKYGLELVRMYQD